MEAVHTFDVIIVGAGGAGLMCAIQAGRRGRRVALLDHSTKIGRKILISGGGRCNFTNLHASPGQYVSENPDFCRSALARFTPQDFTELVKAHGIAFHEKKPGQLFCDKTAQAIVEILVAECRAAGVTILLDHHVRAVEKPDRFLVRTDRGDFAAPALVIATGGLSVPTTGASDFGYRLARQFGLRVVPTAPALDGFVFDEAEQRLLGGLTGLSMDATVTCRHVPFREQVLFTHVGLSGPAALQASLHWHPGDIVEVDWLPALPGAALGNWLMEQKKRGTRAEVKTVLARHLPERFANQFCAAYLTDSTKLTHVTKADLETLCQRLRAWRFVPKRTVGYSRAEVTRGGVDTRELSSKTMEAAKVPGLYFIGEVVDVTGWLGGYNFQWAWASGWAAGQAV